MVTVYRGSNWKIAINGRDHGVPHFHIEGSGFRCSVSIETGDTINGTAPADVLRDAKAGADENRAVLTSKWQELNA